MLTVKLEILPGLSQMFGDGDNTLLLEEKVGDGESVKDLLLRLGGKHQEFGKIMFGGESGKPTGQVSIVLNNRLLELQGGLDREIEDGDSIVLLPAFAGGGIAPEAERSFYGVWR